MNVRHSGILAAFFEGCRSHKIAISSLQNDQKSGIPALFYILVENKLIL
jgi:hypothetical protein